MADNTPNASNAQLGRRGHSGLQLQRTHAKRKALYQTISEQRKRNDGAEIDFQEILDELHEQKFYENVEDSQQIKRIWKEDVYFDYPDIYEACMSGKYSELLAREKKKPTGNMLRQQVDAARARKLTAEAEYIEAKTRLLKEEEGIKKCIRQKHELEVQKAISKQSKRGKRRELIPSGMRRNAEQEGIFQKPQAEQSSSEEESEGSDEDEE